MAAQDHVIYDPEWAIDESGAGSFQIECQCGWLKRGFDTASLARSAGFNHTTTGAGTPPPSDASGSDAEAPRRRRFWSRR